MVSTHIVQVVVSHSPTNISNGNGIKIHGIHITKALADAVLIILSFFIESS